MKKKLLSFFLALVMTLALFVPLQLSADAVANVKVDSAVGTVSQFVDIKVTMAKDMDVSVGTLVVKYDSRLELVSFTNGTVFANTYSKVTGEENGTFTYVGDFEVSADKMAVSAKNGDVIFTLKLKVPSDASIDDLYNVTILEAQSSFVTSQIVEENLTVLETACVASNGSITVKSLTPCTGEHTYGEAVVVREQSYMQGAYSYKTCTACGYIDRLHSSPKETNIFTPLGTAIKYTGNPSGIGAHFGVNMDAVKAVESAGFELEIGIELVYGDRSETQIFYGDNVPALNASNFEDGVISAAIENVQTQKKGTICAYAKIIQPDGTARIERTYNSLNGNKNVAIVDVVLLMNINKYSEANRDYLNAVANGFVE